MSNSYGILTMTKCMVYISELKINTNNETEPNQQLHEMKLIKSHSLVFWKPFKMFLFCSFFTVQCEHRSN